MPYRTCCLFLASKVEEYRVDVNALCDRVGVEPSALLDFELILLSGLRFHLTVFQPQRSLYGFLLDWFNVMKDVCALVAFPAYAHKGIATAATRNIC